MKFSKEILKGSLEPLVLSVLQDLKETYGYELLKVIHKESDAVFDLKETTLYPLLYRLEEKGWIESRIKSTPSGKDRRYYRLTRSGTRQLENYRSEFRIYLKGMKKMLNLGA